MTTDRDPHDPQPENIDARFEGRVSVSDNYDFGEHSYDVIISHTAMNGSVVANLATRRRANALAKAIEPFVNHRDEVARRRERYEMVVKGIGWETP